MKSKEEFVNVYDIIPGMIVFHNQLGIGKIIEKNKDNTLQISFLFHAQLFTMSLTPDLYLVDKEYVVVKLGNIIQNCDEIICLEDIDVPVQLDDGTIIKNYRSAIQSIDIGLYNKNQGGN